jgi:hypothetical protein
MCVLENIPVNLKTKAFGFVVGAALSLTLIAGVVAAPVSTTLSPATGACDAAATSGSIDLGTWTWNPTTKSYDLTPSSNPGTITTNVTQNIQPNIDCNITMSISGLTGSNGGEIPATDLTVTAASGGTGTGGSYVVPTDADGVDLVLTATLASVSNTAAPGTYSGTITVGSATAAS